VAGNLDGFGGWQLGWIWWLATGEELQKIVVGDEGDGDGEDDYEDGGDEGGTEQSL
jgi:hypothetical protein